MTDETARGLKVLHVIDSLGVGGGAEHSLVAMLPELADRGITSEVVCLIPREGGLQAQVIDMGVRLDVVPAGRFPVRARWLRERLVDSRADLLHASLVSSCFLSRAAARRTGVPQVNSLVQTTYDLELRAQAGISPWKLRTMATVDGFTARRYVDHVHSLTAAVTTEATEVLGIDPGRITEIPRGRSTEQLGVRSAERRRRVRAGLGLPDDAPVVLNVARQDQQKSQALLVEAFAEVVAEQPGAVLLIAGREGNATADIRAAVRATSMEGSVTLLGHRTDVPDLLAAADVFTLPSVSEGFGGAGRPVRPGPGARRTSRRPRRGGDAGRSGPPSIRRALRARRRRGPDGGDVPRCRQLILTDPTAPSVSRTTRARHRGAT